jgi:hypothetical protein
VRKEGCGVLLHMCCMLEEEGLGVVWFWSVVVGVEERWERCWGWCGVDEIGAVLRFVCAALGLD